MSHKQLNQKQRYHIFGLLEAGYNQTQIANEVGVHKSTISRELKRNVFWWGSRIAQYKPDYAQAYCKDRHKRKAKRVKLTKKVKAFICEKLKEQWSPEQISGYAKYKGLFSLSHEAIYQFILKNKQLGGSLYKNLRHQAKKYRKRYGSPKRQGPIKNRRFIHERPSIVDKKQRVGDWEIDTIIGKNRKEAIVTVVERVSKFTILKKVTRKTAEQVMRATIEGLEDHKEKVLTITSDNGSEFAQHESISHALEANFYFAHPYSSWERGLNENTNGLVRQYLKKGADFSGVGDQYLGLIMSRLNSRPRKSLGFACPAEKFAN